MVEKKSTEATSHATGERGSPSRRKPPEEDSDDRISSGKVKERLTAAQVAKHLVIQIVTLNVSFGRLLENSLKPTSVGDGRSRNLLPLPLWPDVRTALQGVIDDQRYKDAPGEWRERGATKSKASKQLRVEGYLHWHGLIVVALNWLHSDGSLSGGTAPWGSSATVQQENALNRIWKMVKTFVDEKPAKGGVPRTPPGGWEKELEKLKVGYSGEVVEKARPLTLEQVLPGLPSEDHGGLVDIMEVVDERMRRRLERPDLVMKQDVTAVLPKPQVMCSDEEWPPLVKALYHRKLVRPVSSHPLLGEEAVLNGKNHQQWCRSASPHR